MNGEGQTHFPLTPKMVQRMGSTSDQLAREATARNEPYEAYLLRLTEVEVATRAANAIAARIRAAALSLIHI